MKYPCGMIRDLLPLYIDDVCNEESKVAVAHHLSECVKCEQYYKSMKSEDGFAENQSANSEDTKMADSLKKVKMKINKRIRNIILCSAAAIALFIFGFNLLFHMPVKEVDIKDVSVSANVYPLEKIASDSAGDVSGSESVTILSDEDDTSEQVSIKFPELGAVSISEDTIKKNGYATVISISSKYFLRAIKYAENRERNDDTIYISAFKTTLLNNKAEDYQKTMINLEFKQINRIVFVEDDGTETVLWSR